MHLSQKKFVFLYRNPYLDLDKAIYPYSNRNLRDILKSSWISQMYCDVLKIFLVFIITSISLRCSNIEYSENLNKKYVKIIKIICITHRV